MNTTIRARVDSFVEDLSDLIRQAALDAVQQALQGRTSTGARPAGVASKKKAGRKAGPPAAGKRGPGRPPSVPTAETERKANQLLELIRQQPGLRLEEISRTVGASTDDLRAAITLLVDQGRVRREGKARGTRYVAGGGGGARKKAGKKSAGKKGKKAKKKTA